MYKFVHHSTKQKLECLFDSHVWIWTLTETRPDVFIIAGHCSCCGKHNPHRKICFSLDDAYNKFKEIREQPK